MKTLFPIPVSFVTHGGMVPRLKFQFLLNPLGDPRGMHELLNDLDPENKYLPEINFILPMQPIRGDGEDKDLIMQQYGELCECRADLF